MRQLKTTSMTSTTLRTRSSLSLASLPSLVTSPHRSKSFSLSESRTPMCLIVQHCLTLLSHPMTSSLLAMRVRLGLTVAKPTGVKKAVAGSEHEEDYDFEDF